MRMAALLGAAMLLSASRTNPCTFRDVQHYHRAEQLRAAAMVEEDNCPQAKGPCAERTVELVYESRREVIYISPECRSYIRRGGE